MNRHELLNPGEAPSPGHLDAARYTMRHDQETPRQPAPITDLSDKGRRAGKLLRYKVSMYQTPRRETSNETPVVVAAFRSYGDAFVWANTLRSAPCVTEVLIHN